MTLHHKSVDPLSTKNNFQKGSKINRKRILIGYIGSLSIFSFLYQALGVFNHTDTVRYVFFDEYILDLIQLLRLNAYYIPAYLWTVFSSTLLLSWLWRKQWGQSDIKKAQIPLWFGCIVFVIPLLTGCLQLVLHWMFDSIGSIGQIKQTAEIFLIVTNPILLGVSLIVAFSPILVGRMLPLKPLEWIQSLFKKRIDLKNLKNDERSNPEENEYESPTENMKKKWKKYGLKIWSIIWITLMLGVFVYFTSLIFIDYLTLFMDGEALGSLSRSQSFKIWIYYIFAILVGFMVSLVYSLMHELLPNTLRKPFQLSTRIKTFYASQILSVFCALIYYIVLKTQLSIEKIDLSLFFLYIPSIFFSGKTVLLTLFFIGLPAVVFHLVAYPIKSIGNSIIEKIKTIQR